MKFLTISKNKCFIIAEAGVNHNGSIQIAKDLIDAAKDAGADAVKFQTFKTDSIVTKSAPKAEYQKKSSKDPSQYEMIKKLELSPDEFRELSAYADNKGIMFLSSPFDEESIDLLDEIGVPAFKLGSGEITNLPLIKYLVTKGKPIILSTGMASLCEIEEAIKISKGIDLFLMYCNQLHCIGRGNRSQCNADIRKCFQASGRFLRSHHGY